MPFDFKIGVNFGVTPVVNPLVPAAVETAPVLTQTVKTNSGPAPIGDGVDPVRALTSPARVSPFNTPTNTGARRDTGGRVEVASTVDAMLPVPMDIPRVMVGNVLTVSASTFTRENKDVVDQAARDASPDLRDQIEGAGRFFSRFTLNRDGTHNQLSRAALDYADPKTRHIATEVGYVDDQGHVQKVTPEAYDRYVTALTRKRPHGKLLTEAAKRWLDRDFDTRARAYQAYTGAAARAEQTQEESNASPTANRVVNSAESVAGVLSGRARKDQADALQEESSSRIAARSEREEDRRMALDKQLDTSVES
ncbi:MAG: hypothetical protein H7Z43_13060 [Clostridia bacterium]|nr:hypothetical protein [Deltaproteobacteria bacterium]